MDDESPLLQSSSRISCKVKAYGPTVCWAFAVNFVFGAGVLQLPYAFHEAGLILSTILMVFVSVMSVINAMYIVESIYRRFAVLKSSINEDENEFLKAGVNIPEVADLCHFFLGRAGKVLWQYSTVLFCLGAMWLYFVVWASSATAVVPLPFITLGSNSNCDGIQKSDSIPSDCKHAYWVFAILFCCIMIPLLLSNLQDQVKVQLFLTIFGVSCLFVMIVTVISAAFTRPFSGHSSRSSGPFLSAPKMFDFGGLSFLLSASVFSQLLTHGVPELSKLLRDKKLASTVFLSAVGTTCSLYIAVSVLCSLYFGDNVEKIITLNWTTYSGDNAVHVHIIRYLIVLFPVISISAVYPLYTIAAGNNLLRALPLSWRRRMGEKWGPKICRLILTAMAFSGSMLLRDVKFITTFTGFCGFVLSFFIPAFLQLKSRDMCERVSGSSVTPFSSWASSSFVAIIDLIVGFCAMCFVGFTAVKENVGK